MWRRWRRRNATLSRSTCVWSTTADSSRIGTPWRATKATEKRHVRSGMDDASTCFKRLCRLQVYITYHISVYLYTYNYNSLSIIICARNVVQYQYIYIYNIEYTCLQLPHHMEISISGAWRLAGDSPIQVFFTAGHVAMLGGVGGTGGGPRGGHGAQPQKNPFSAPVRGLPGSKGLRASRVSGRPGGMALIRKYGIMMKRQVGKVGKVGKVGVSKNVKRIWVVRAVWTGVKDHHDHQLGQEEFEYDQHESGYHEQLHQTIDDLPCKIGCFQIPNWQILTDSEWVIPKIVCFFCVIFGAHPPFLWIHT